MTGCKSIAGADFGLVQLLAQSLVLLLQRHQRLLRVTPDTRTNIVTKCVVLELPQ